jgi:hypothetical protein
MSFLLKVQQNLAELFPCSRDLWKLECKSNELGFLANEISNQNIKEAVWILLTSYIQMKEWRNDLKDGI